MDYKNGKIYTIRSHQTDKIYIGSTTQTLSKRLSGHKGQYKSYLNGKKIYITSLEIIKYGDAYIELLEECPCDNKMMLHKREGECIRAEPNCVNKCVAGRTTKQYYDDNTDKIKEQNKQYYDDNADKIKEYYKEYQNRNADKVKEYQKEYQKQNAEKLKEQKKQYYADNADKLIEQQKQYNADNADKIKEQKKQYYADNADKIKEYRKQKKMEENILT